MAAEAQAGCDAGGKKQQKEAAELPAAALSMGAAGIGMLFESGRDPHLILVNDGRRPAAAGDFGAPAEMVAGGFIPGHGIAGSLGVPLAAGPTPFRPERARSIRRMGDVERAGQDGDFHQHEHVWQQPHGGFLSHAARNVNRAGNRLP